MGLKGPILLLAGHKKEEVLVKQCFQLYRGQSVFFSLRCAKAKFGHRYLSREA